MNVSTIKKTRKNGTHKAQRQSLWLRFHYTCYKCTASKDNVRIHLQLIIIITIDYYILTEIVCVARVVFENLAFSFSFLLYSYSVFLAYSIHQIYRLILSLIELNLIRRNLDLLHEFSMLSLSLFN